ncbi:MAG: NADH-quinone oxidoreductase subunit B family protein [Candidatus Aminicenantales bacterium]
MFELLKLRKRHGRPVIPDIRRAEVHPAFRGFPLLDGNRCPQGCSSCDGICPTEALQRRPLRLDLGKCVFCGQCARICLAGAVRFGNAVRLGSSRRDGLIVVSGQTPEAFAAGAITVRKEIRRLFGRSLKLRQVSAGGCNACEMELAACGNVNFDAGRFGIEFTASPRHADGIVLTGPISRNMAPALHDAYRSIGEPKIVIAAGACAVSGGLFANSEEVDRKFLEEIGADLFVPGCPPHPLTFIRAVLDFLGR